MTVNDFVYICDDIFVPKSKLSTANANKIWKQNATVNSVKDPEMLSNNTVFWLLTDCSID